MRCAKEPTELPSLFGVWDRSCDGLLLGLLIDEEVHADEEWDEEEVAVFDTLLV